MKSVGYKMKKVSVPSLHIVHQLNTEKVCHQEEVSTWALDDKKNQGTCHCQQNKQSQAVAEGKGDCVRCQTTI